ncbi:transcription elongation factor 1 homolog isoform X1 [Hypomesus transpacificus]|uniref:transcription elongation factor 1 homolog isoform X1 n=1 Tax=Hypomesus transpacificus TaxID=137520 RepID=UPI001F07EE6C|nr:transcription elongation factor 1 homolog isoform X1 [Hypomesus transpacificus]
MDDQKEMKQSIPPPAEHVESQETLTELVHRLRTDVEKQAETIGTLVQTLALNAEERTQNVNTIAVLQDNVRHLARHLAAQHMEERFQALRCEMSTELQYLRSLLTSFPAHCSITPEPQRQAAIENLTHELHHSRKLLWEQISVLREEVFNMYGLLKCHRDETQRRLLQSHCKDMCLERLIDSLQKQEAALRPAQWPTDTTKHRMDVSELQSKLQVVAISKGKAPKKKGLLAAKAKPIPSDSEELLSRQQTKGTSTQKVKENVNIFARRK